MESKLMFICPDCCVHPCVCLAQDNKRIHDLNMEKRPTYGRIYMDFARSLARRSTCRRAQVGCVVVSADNHRVLAIGYNGNYRGGPNDCDSSEPGRCGCLHAEDNCLLKMDYNDPARKVLYTTTSPCNYCAKRIINAGISFVYYGILYRDRQGLDILNQAGVNAVHLLD